jgi:hypothetical protein
MFRRYVSAIALATALYSSTSWAEILEITRMRQILPFIGDSTLVVFDLDNTIMETPQMLGSDQWFGYMEKKFEAEGLQKPRSTEQAIDIWMEVQHSSSMQAVEATTPELIRKLQNGSDVKIIALTARPYELRYRTRLQLRNLGVNFETPDSSKVASRLPADLHFDRGILSIGPAQNKGEVLKKFLETNGEQFDRVLFIDDKAKHVQNVEAALSKLNLSNSNFRYGAADPKVNAFDPRIADDQLEIFYRTGELRPDGTSTQY